MSSVHLVIRLDVEKSDISFIENARVLSNTAALTLIAIVVPTLAASSIITIEHTSPINAYSNIRRPSFTICDIVEPGGSE